MVNLLRKNKFLLTVAVTICEKKKFEVAKYNYLTTIFTCNFMQKKISQDEIINLFLKKSNEKKWYSILFFIPFTYWM